MNELDSILNKAHEIIHEYASGKWQSVDRLRELLRELSFCHYAVTKVNIEAAQDFNKEVYKFKGSNAAAVNFAELTVPELRITRKLLITYSKQIDSMRSEISTINKES